MRSMTFHRVALFSTGLAMGFGLSVLVLSGCGKGSGKREVASGTEAESGDETGDGEPAEEAPKAKKTTKGKKKGPGDEFAHIGEIPKDVWPEVWLKNPLAVVSESASVGGVAPQAKTDDSAEKPE